MRDYGDFFSPFWIANLPLSTEYIPVPGSSSLNITLPFPIINNALATDPSGYVLFAFHQFLYEEGLVPAEVAAISAPNRNTTRK